MKFAVSFLVAVVVFHCGYSQAAGKVVVLGVTHSLQLVNPYHQPSALRVLFSSINPQALCIERSPEEFVRNSFYEFTYEQQYCLIPQARDQHVPVYPIDWMSKEDDMALALGDTHYDHPPFDRKKSGFLGFLYFKDSVDVIKPLFYAEEEREKADIRSWYSAYPDKLTYDFYRRAFLYRTYLQALRIRAVASSYGPDETVLVVVGSYHKEDLEFILRDLGIVVVKSSDFGIPSPAEVASEFRVSDAFPILTFNLLGLQAFEGRTSNELISISLKAVDSVHTSEVKLFRIRYGLMTGSISIGEGIGQLQSLRSATPVSDRFTWTGVVDHDRIDSYFDPFGNLTVAQRVRLELARLFYESGETQHAEALKRSLLAEHLDLKKALLEKYWITYLEKSTKRRN